jgi:hypothetical protein
MATVWEQIRESLDRGEDPRILLTYDHIVNTSPGKAGGANKLGPVTKWDIYFAMVMQRTKASSSIHRCLNIACRTQLHGYTKIVCNEECRLKAIHYYVTVLFMLRNRPMRIPKPVEDFPDANSSPGMAPASQIRAAEIVARKIIKERRIAYEQGAKTPIK